MGDTAEKHKAKLSLVLQEILKSEQSYRDSLNKFVEHFIQPLEQALIDDPELGADPRIKTLLQQMQPITQILEAANALHKKLEKLLAGQENSADPEGLAKEAANILTQSVPAMQSIYFDYIVMYEKMQELQTEILETNPKYKALEDGFRVLPEINGPSPQSFLIMPVQRIPRYELLLREAQKYSAEAEQDPATTPVANRGPVTAAFVTIQETVKNINENKRAYENDERLHESLAALNEYAASEEFKKKPKKTQEFITALLSIPPKKLSSSQVERLIELNDADEFLASKMPSMFKRELDEILQTLLDATNHAKQPNLDTTPLDLIVEQQQEQTAIIRSISGIQPDENIGMLQRLFSRTASKKELSEEIKEQLPDTAVTMIVKKDSVAFRSKAKDPTQRSADNSEICQRICRAELGDGTKVPINVTINKGSVLAVMNFCEQLVAKQTENDTPITLVIAPAVLKKFQDLANDPAHPLHKKAFDFLTTFAPNALEDQVTSASKFQLPPDMAEHRPDIPLRHGSSAGPSITHAAGDTGPDAEAAEPEAAAAQKHPNPAATRSSLGSRKS